MRDPNTDAGKARRQPLGRTLPPPDRLPGMLGQIASQMFGRDQIGLVATPVLLIGLPLRFGPVPGGHIRIFG